MPSGFGARCGSVFSHSVALPRISEKPYWGFPRPCVLGYCRIFLRSSERGKELAPLFPLLASLRRAEYLALSLLEEAVGGGPTRGAALPTVTSQGAEGRQAGSAPSPPPPSAGSIRPPEMLLPLLQLSCTLLWVRQLYRGSAQVSERALEPGDAAGSGAAGCAAGHAACRAPGSDRSSAKR